MNDLPCGCRYDGPVQVLCCVDHNVAARNLNRAQAMLVGTEVENERVRMALDKMIRCSYGCQCPGPSCTATDEAEALLARDRMAHEKMGDTVEELDNLKALLIKRINEMDTRRELLVKELALVEEKKAALEKKP